ncbi:MAG TPA: hypothetical protein VNN21_11950 [Dehalococcoidia bacterium]|nr:hypothetical protein [Dehalococcoidia bacterium]
MAFTAAVGLIAALYYVRAPDHLRPIFDDSYITLTFARNLADTGKLSFDSVNWTTGATSPLHVFLLAGLLKLGAAPFFTTIAFGVACNAALAAGVYLLAWALFRSRLASLLAALAISFTSYTALDAGNGLETSLFMALLAFALASYFLDRTPRGRAVTGFLIALLVLTRPEGAFMLPAVVIYRWIERAPGEPLRDYVRDCVLLAGPGTLAVAALALYSLVVSGSIGGTATAKMRFFREDEQPLGDKIGAVLYNMGLFLASIVPLAALAAIKLQARQCVLFGLVLLPMVVAYTVLFPGGFGHYFYRYQHPVLPILAALAGGGAAHLISVAVSHRDYVVKALVVAVLAIAAYPTWTQYEAWRDTYRQASNETYYDLEAMAKDLNTIVRPGEVLAAHDIGAVGYFGRFQVLDTVGLVNPDVTPYHEGRRFPAYFETVHVDYLLTFPDWDFFFFGLDPDNHPERFQFVKEYPGGPIRQSPYRLYRVLDR